MVNSRLTSKQSQAATPAVNVASAKAAVAAAQNQIDEDTKAMNDSTDKAEATQLAMKVEAAQTELQKAKVSKEEAKGVSTEATQAACIAVKDAVEEEASDAQEVEQAVEKKAQLEASMKEATSMEQVDNTETKVDAATRRLIAAKAALAKSVTTEANAGIAQVVAGVEAGVVSGDKAVQEAKKIEKEKTVKNVNMAVSKVEDAKAKVKATQKNL